MLLNYSKTNFQGTLKQMIINEEKAKENKIKKDIAKITAQMFKTVEDIQKEKESTTEKPKEETIIINKYEYLQMKKDREQLKEQTELNFTLLSEIQDKEIIIAEQTDKIEKQNKELAEYRPRSDFIKIDIYGQSVNDMYHYVYGQTRRTNKYNDWEIEINQKLDQIGIKKMKQVFKLDDIDFTKPIRLDITYGLLEQSDLDNVQKAFQDCIFRYLAKYGYINDKDEYGKDILNDKIIHKLILEKVIIGTKKSDKIKGFIKFSICNK